MMAGHHENLANFGPENKYDFQIGMKDIDFTINMQLLRDLGYIYPFRGIEQAEKALTEHIITLNSFNEIDDTEHLVLSFDPRPVGYSGFMNCVRHSLMITNLGLFEIGRYSGIDINSENHSWQWFIHKRLLNAENVASLLEDNRQNPDQFIQEMTQVYLTQ